MTPVELTKNVANFIVGAGTYTIARTVIKHHVEPETVTQKVTVNASSLVIASMAAEATTTWTDDKIDRFAAWWNENVTNAK